MYDIAKKARAGMKAKAQRLAGEKDHKTDSSDWTPAPELNADVKTGMRPVSRRAYKKGGKVVGVATKARADRKPRKAGGPVKAAEKGEQPLVDRYINRDLKKANEYRDGKKHVGALKHGGRAKKDNGGGLRGEQAEYAKAYRRAEDTGKEARRQLIQSFNPFTREGTPDKVVASQMAKNRAKEGYERAMKETGYGPEPSEIITQKSKPSRTMSYEELKKTEFKKGGRAKHAAGGRAKKQDGGGMDPRLGIVKPKVMEFGQNVVTPGLKKGGRAKKEVGGPAIEAGKAAMSAMTPAPSVGPSPSASNVPPVGSGLLPQPKGNYEKPPAYDPDKYNPGDKIKDILGKFKGTKDSFRFPGMKKGGRTEKTGGGSLRSQFNEAFRNARAAGEKTFEWNGKSYTTELAKPNKAPMGAMPGSSRAGAPPMGAGPGSRSANVAPPQGAGPGSSAPEQEGFFSRVFRRAQEVSGETPYRKKHITVEFGPTAAQKKNQADWDAPGARKKGGRVAKQIGGALGRGMPSMAPGAAMRPQVPQVGQGMMGRGMPSQFGQGMMGRGPAPQAMANAQGRPFQPGGKFATQPAPMPTPGTPGGPPITNFPMPMQPQPIASDPFGASMGRMQNTQGAPRSMGVDPFGASMGVPMNRSSMPRSGNIGSPMGVVAGPSSIGGQVGPNLDENFYSGSVTPDQYLPAVMPNPMARKNGGRVARADGGPTKSKGKSQGKSNINIIISTGKADKPQQPDQPPMGAGMPPMPPPAPMMGAGAPPPMGGPGMPPMGPPPAPMGAPPPMMPPMPRKAGGRVSKVAHSYKDMTAGAASGEGRLQKTDIAKRGSKPAFEKGLNLSDAKNYPNKVPGATGGRTARKTGGKVYRSYKDMDAGAGSGKGRLEKTEIQSRKK